MKTVKLSPCFACFCAKSAPELGYCTPEKLPRKKKKQLPALLALREFLRYDGYFDFTSCSLASTYKTLKRIVYKAGYLLKYIDELRFLKKFWDQEIYIDNDGRLCWLWEYDDDFTGGSSGIMPIAYNHQQAGQTWAHTELKALIKCLCSDAGIKKRPIANDLDLLKFIRENWESVKDIER